MRNPPKNSIFKVKRSVVEERGLGEIDLSFFIDRWITRFPVDKMWREKHGIAFNSPQHRETYVTAVMSDMLITAFIRKYLKEIPTLQAKYHGGKGEYLKHRENKVSDAEIKEAFDRIDIDNLEYDEDGNLIL